MLAPQSSKASKNLRWVYQEGAVQFGYDTAEGVVVDRQNHVFASGFTNGGLDGNTSAGDYDAFVVKVETRTQALTAARSSGRGRRVNSPRRSR